MEITTQKGITTKKGITTQKGIVINVAENDFITVRASFYKNGANILINPRDKELLPVVINNLMRFKLTLDSPYTQWD